LKVKHILITQPKPETEKSPYIDFAKKHNLKVDFRSFIEIEGITAKEFRRERVSFLDYTGIIFTSKHAATHFFRLCKEMRVSMPESMKYFCISEATAYYLQKFVTFKKRKALHGKETIASLIDLIKKHKTEKFFLPCSDNNKEQITGMLDNLGIGYTKAPVYKTVCSNLSDLAVENYDILVFFTPSGIKSLLKNFPDFKQDTSKIAAFGTTTSKAVIDAGLELTIQAPLPNVPSMVLALEQYMKELGKK